METNQRIDREEGEKMAVGAGALKTVEVIKDENSCFQDIFNAGIAEVGPERFVKALQQGPEIWSRLALRLIPDLQPHMKELSAFFASTTDNTVARSGDAICKFRLYEGACASGIVKINNLAPDDRFLNYKNTYDINPTEWNIPEGGSMTLWYGIEDDFLIGLAPDNSNSFTFDSNSTKIAYYQSWGTAGTQRFGLLDHAV